MKLLNSTLSVVFCIYLMNFSTANAQTNDPVDYQTIEITNSTGTQIYTENTTDVVGSPLLKESFENGRILFTGDKASEVVPINYDAHKNQILFIKNNQIRILNIQNVRGFAFETTANFQQSGKVQEVYTLQLRNEEFGFTEKTPVQVLYNQETGLKLLGVFDVRFMKGNSKDPFTGKVIDRYIPSTTYYLQTHDGNIHKLRRLRDKFIINELPKKHRKQLKSFIKKNDLDGRSQKDLVKLLAHYDANVAGN